MLKREVSWKLFLLDDNFNFLYHRVSGGTI